jgi:hypothetical protein
MKSLDWSVETLGLDYNSTGLCMIIYINQSSERKHDRSIIIQRSQGDWSFTKTKTITSTANSCRDLQLFNTAMHTLIIVALFGIALARILDKSYSFYRIGLQELLLNLITDNIRSSDILTSLNWTNLETRRTHSLKPLCTKLLITYGF